MKKEQVEMSSAINIRSGLFVLFTLINFASIILLYNHYYHPFKTIETLKLEAPSPTPAKVQTFLVVANNVHYIGLERRYESNKVAEFLGIAYAQAPIGQLRHRAPRPLSSVNNNNNITIDAQHWRASCLQPDNRLQVANETFSEDCLYLNIWTRLNKTTAQLPQKLRPVLVLIHTGAFVFGSAAERQYNGRVLSALADIVVVSFNYRLNYFGYAYAGDNDLITPNVGMLDQVAALRWVNNNVEHFGGDPKRITLVGQSSGGMSVGMHIDSPLSAGLFQQAILLSGSPLQATSLSQPKKVQDFWKHFALKVNCLGDIRRSIDKEVVECLDNKLAADRNLMPTMDMVKLLSSDRLFVNIPVVAEGEFQPQSQTELLEQINGNNIRAILFGFTDDEGSWIAALEDRKRFGPKVAPNLSSKQAKRILRQYLDLMDARLQKEKDIVDYYLVQSYHQLLQQTKSLSTKSKQDDDNDEGEEKATAKTSNIDTNVLLSRLLTSSLGDHYIACPLNRFAEKLSSKGVPVYQYHWCYKGDGKTSRFWNVFESVWCGRWMGSCHSFEMYALFGVPLTDKDNFDQQDRIVSYKMMEMVKLFLHQDGYVFENKCQHLG